MPLDRNMKLHGISELLTHIVPPMCRQCAANVAASTSTSLCNVMLPGAN